ncbi:cytochrome c [Breoghania corrubedonensis]|uniref:Cytochrome c n=1 Tax=Breoghania corrubedonensis TaxID=665038 RepID=A0A2T5VF29_9HYPH|nr:cytochrome c family protein [Breoghania corrubedonensis]PTW62364.1 cytochrome c [Breoghania corrubedonensis]
MKRMIVIAGAALLATATATAALADGDPAKGEKVFRKCKACHMIGPDAKNRVGPELNGIIGRKIATAPDYKYSKGMTEFGETHDVWSAELLHEYLPKPRDLVKGTKMAFAGLKKDDDISDIVAYLSQFNEDGSKK